MTSLRHQLLAAAATLACLAAAPALAQGGVGVLVEQASFWRAQGQPARAAAALERALAAHPSNPDALAAAAQLQIELGQPGGAQDFLTRLRAAAPADARIAGIEGALRRARPVEATSQPGAAAAEEATAALDAGDPARAAAAYEAVLARNPEAPGALGGLGLARLRQGRAAEARDLLLRAFSGGADEARRWAGALDEASFAAELAEARRLAALGAAEAAERLLLRAARREVADLAEAEALLGELALRRGEWAEAEARFRAAAHRRPFLPAARSGLLESLRRQGRIAEAESLARAAAPGTSARADALRLEAARTEDPEASLALLRDALLAAPASPWARLDLARLLTRQGRGGEARALMEEAFASLPAAEAAHAAALHAEGEGRFAEAAALIERVPDRLRGPDHVRLLRSLRWQAEISGAMEQAPAGRRAALLAMAGRADPTGEAGLRALRALLRAGDREGAGEALRLLLAPQRAATPAMRLALAAALVDSGMEGEAAGLLRQIEAEASLAPAQRRQLAALSNPGAPLASAPASPSAIAAEPPRPYQGAQDPRVAGRIAEAVLRRDPRNVEARLGAVEAALARREIAAAEAHLAEGRLLNANDPRVSLMEARVARAGGDQRRARTALMLAADQRRAQVGGGDAPYRRTMLAGPAQGPQAASPYIPLDSGTPGVAAAGVTPSQLRASEDPLLSEIGRQLAEVNEEASGRFSPNASFRTRSGDGGLDRLNEYSVGAEASMPLPTVGGELLARVQGVAIDNGGLDASTRNLRRFGSNAVVLPGPTATVTRQQAAALTPRDESASGVGLGIAYARNGFTADVGSTPLGFREQNILGGIEVAPRLSDTLQLRLRGERRSVTDSLLSWSGMRDAQSGQIFGGVVRTTGHAQLEYNSGRLNTYAGGGYSSITGRNVADNNRLEVGAGMSYALMQEPDAELVAGLNLVYFAYDKNLRLFSLGHGGYFSPQSYVGASIPVDYRARRGNWAYRLGGSLGFAYFREKTAPYYPTNGALQAVLESQAAGDQTVSAFYPAQRETSVTAGARADVEYAITPSLRIGASARYDKSADFSEARGLIYARYRFDP
ncbi:cellulose biosynthesis protein BcsC [Muricoccus pecuniae]|uniref:Tfp pilus assembly protein PilF n=1 Tax=Muricoccus pecuniae TaxID=693023 RepID=A0A840YCX5_9PROT|nr:cellulose biosynthesis protein BcsC [Roseomonas pecuniae]MBB5693961.1 Tfp pilus assembly protein PilF [Roseomonas pecuniae]